MDGNLKKKALSSVINITLSAGVAWLWHIAVVKLEACWRNTNKHQFGLTSTAVV